MSGHYPIFLLHEQAPGGVEATLFAVSLVILWISIYRWPFLAEAMGIRNIVKLIGSQKTRILCILATITLMFLLLRPYLFPDFIP